MPRVAFFEKLPVEHPDFALRYIDLLFEFTALRNYFVLFDNDKCLRLEMLGGELRGLPDQPDS